MSEPWAHVVSISGGKDSTAMYLLALERMQKKGRRFTPVMADTGNEHPWTYDYVAGLPAKTGGPEIIWVKADFSRQIAGKREVVATKWRKEGVPEALVERALASLHPTGNPFLDLCLWKTRFPSSKARFCTEELKILPMFEAVQRPLLAAGKTLISWQGVRAEESYARSTLPKWQRMNPAPYNAPKPLTEGSERWRAYAYRPLIDWKVEDVWAMHERHGLARNPLYDHGMGRVGCMPCIMAKKGELLQIAARFPEHIDRLEEWERIVSEVSKRGFATFFDHTDDPVVGMDKTSPSLEMKGIRSRVEWSKTSRGGVQYDLMALSDFNLACSAHGACE